MNHAYILRSSLKAGTRSRLDTFEPEIDGVTMARLTLDRLSEDEIAQLPECPTLIVSHSFQCNSVPEVFGKVRGSVFITPRMRTYLEHLEPGVHRYFPIRLRSEISIGGKTDHGEHFLLLPPPLLDCLVIEETQFAKGFGASGWKKGKDGISRGSISGRPGAKCTLKKPIVEGRHLWLTKVADQTEYTCSDEFWEGVKKEKPIWEPHTQCDLK